MSKSTDAMTAAGGEALRRYDEARATAVAAHETILTPDHSDFDFWRPLQNLLAAADEIAAALRAQGGAPTALPVTERDEINAALDTGMRLNLTLFTVATRIRAALSPDSRTPKDA